VRLYRESYSARNVWFQHDKWYKAHRVTTGDELVPAEQLVTTDFYTEWLEPQQLFYRLCGVVGWQGTRLIYLESLRSSAHKAYGASERRLLESLLAHFESALYCNNQSWRLAIYQEMLNTLSCGMLAVDSSRRILVATEPALKELREGSGLVIRSHKLRALAPANDTKLQSLVTSAATAERGKYERAGGALIIRRSGRSLPLWLIVVPMGRALRTVVGQEREVALVLLSAPDRPSRASMKTVSEYYGLTPAELRIVALMLEGYSLKDAAGKAGVSINTARTHMKHIYAKTRTERQVDLIRVLLAGAANNSL
jgi:DNA-binding CsgD family transcriptional regulator